MQEKKYIPLLGSLYANFIFQGMAAIILSQTMTQLQSQWQASVSQLTLVISGIGLGRVISLFFAGRFSDRFGRKPTVLIAIVTYFVFFGGILLSKNYYQGFVVALFAGFSNAFLDTSTYPTLMEAYPNAKENSALGVLNKAFISVGQFVLPFLAKYVLENQLYYGWIYLFCFACLALNFGLLLRQTFPARAAAKETIVAAAVALDEAEEQRASKAVFKIEGIALLIFSFVSVSLFNVFVLWIPSFAEQLKITSQSDSLMFVSVYSLGSFVSVFLTSFLVKRGSSVPRLLIVCLTTSGASLLLMIIAPSFLTILIAAVCIGVFAAGGIWQLGLTLILDFFPKNKGRITSYYSLATSVSVMITPYFTGILFEKNLYAVFIYDFILTMIGVGAALVINHRYYHFEKETTVQVIRED